MKNCVRAAAPRVVPLLHTQDSSFAGRVPTNIPVNISHQQFLLWGFFAQANQLVFRHTLNMPIFKLYDSIISTLQVVT